MGRKTITADIHSRPDRVRVNVKQELFDAKPSHRNLNTGIYLCGFSCGRVWAIVKTYSIWVDSKGYRTGPMYEAFNMLDPMDMADFKRIVEDNEEYEV